MNEKTIDQIEEEVLSYEVCDEAVEAAGTRTEIAEAWTFICTGIECHQVFSRRKGKAPARETGALRTEGVGVSGS